MDDEESCRAADDAGSQKRQFVRSRGGSPAALTRLPSRRGMSRRSGVASATKRSFSSITRPSPGMTSPASEEHDVPRHHLIGWDIDGLPIPQDVRLGLDELEQFLQGVGRPPLLPEAEQPAGQDNREDDGGSRYPRQERATSRPRAGGSG